MKFIFRVRIRQGCTAEQYIDAWRQASTLIQTCPGAQGTVLHREIEQDRTFLAIATWESKAARDAAMQYLDGLGPEVQEARKLHQQFGDIEVLGHFEEVTRVDP